LSVEKHRDQDKATITKYENPKIILCRHPFIALSAFNLDFLCIHPFRDGNGRVSRLLLLLQCYQLGYDVGRYISIERLIEENKERYYETLEQSSVGWHEGRHEGRHDPWPYINYILFIIKSAYKEFESRLGQIKSPRGAKTQMIEAAIIKSRASFSLSQIESECPGVSRGMIRRTLRNLQEQGRVECLGRGPGAEWRQKR
jgi:Fic family protein